MITLTKILLINPYNAAFSYKNEHDCLIKLLTSDYRIMQKLLTMTDDQCEDELPSFKILFEDIDFSIDLSKPQIEAQREKNLSNSLGDFDFLQDFTDNINGSFKIHKSSERLDESNEKLREI